MHSTVHHRALSLALITAIFAATSATAQTAIPASTGNFNANTPGTYLLNAGDTRTNTGSTETISVGSATAGTYTLNIDGSVTQTGTGRAIRSANNNVTFAVNVGSAGLVRSAQDDAIQARNGNFSVNNQGQIRALYNGLPATAAGQALDLASAVGGSVVNGSSTNTTALIQADGHDAVRLGSNMTLTNWGSIIGNGVVNDNAVNRNATYNFTNTYSTSEGISFEAGQNSSVINNGIVSGARHGVEADIAARCMTVTNNAGASIIGKNGSGIGLDALDGANSVVTINNYGLIRGDYAGAGNIIDRAGTASPTNDGDGDGIDVDGTATINNFSTGIIRSTGAGGFDSLGRANNSEAIAIGGGIIVNDGLIQGADRGIIVNNDSVASRSGTAATSITNAGTIEGQNGYAIRLENKLGDARDNDTIVNSGTILGSGAIPDPTATVLRQYGETDGNSTGTLDGVAYTGTGSARFIRGDGSAIQMGEGDDTLTNTGTITGSNGRAVNLEGGADTLNHNAGTITGEINGGAGTDTLNLGAAIAHSGAVENFEKINVATGSAELSGVLSGVGGLEKGGSGALVLSSANTYTGPTTITAGSFRVQNTTGSATGAGDVTVQAGARLGGPGRIDGNLILNGGMTPGALAIGGDLTWNGQATEAIEYDFSAPAAFTIDGDFLKGTGADFVFDFLGQGVTGEFVLLSWGGTTDFTAADFSAENLAVTHMGDFTIVGNDLIFTAVPEPASFAAVAGAALLGYAATRRRRARV
jgi:autotransporter-associated beta strand protein